ncbi:MAG: Na-translocating system protein MpsC family protein [Phycisphaerales bacterium]
MNDVEPLAGLRILIVEDIGMVASALKTMLEELGCKVVGIAARVPEAEKFAQHEQLDGVLLDLNLGGAYSFAVTDILHERDIPFIILSGYDVEQVCPKLANEPQMPKPFDRGPLEEMMLSVFCGKEHRKERDDAGSTRTRGPQSKPPLKTRGELESAICLGMTRFQQEFIGRGPSDVQAHLINDLLIVRMKGVMTAAEQHLAQSQPPEKGRDLLKQVRSQMMESARKQTDSMIQVITGVTVRSLHHDISTQTGEEIVVFTLSQEPTCREVSRR